MLVLSVLRPHGRKLKNFSKGLNKVKTNKLLRLIGIARTAQDGLDKLVHDGSSVDYENSDIALVVDRTDALVNTLGDLISLVTSVRDEIVKSETNPKIKAGVIPESAIGVYPEDDGLDKFVEVADSSKLREVWDNGTYILEAIDNGLDFIVVKSPFFTYALLDKKGFGRFNTNSCEPSMGAPVYCLGPDWFEDKITHFRVYCVSDFEKLEKGAA